MRQHYPWLFFFPCLNSLCRCYILAGLLVTLPGLLQAQAQPCFTPSLAPVTTDASDGNYSLPLVLGDFKRDGKPDVAVSNPTTVNVGVLPNNRIWASPSTWYRDVDGDGFGDPVHSIMASSQPAGYVSDNTDCDDSDADVRPNQTWYFDNDGDGYASGSVMQCERPAHGHLLSELLGTEDCFDFDATVHAPVTWYFDHDNDGYHSYSITACPLPPPGRRFVRTTKGIDCDDNNLIVHAEQTFYRDNDNDGQGDPSKPAVICAASAEGYVLNNTDCNDADNTIYLFALEIRDDKDNNCNGEIDEGEILIWFRDFDKDGFGDPKQPFIGTNPPAGYVSNNRDCNDFRVFYQDTDNDGWGSSTKLPCGTITRTGDCDDGNRRVHSPQTFYRDADGDSWGNASVTTKVCSSEPPAGYVANRMDCNDNDRTIRYCPPASVTFAERKAEQAFVARPSPVLLLTAYPNPVKGLTRIEYSLLQEARVSIRVYDVAGREVSIVFSGRRSAGTHYAEYNSTKLSSGVYFCQMTATVDSKTMVQTVKLVKTE